MARNGINLKNNLCTLRYAHCNVAKILYKYLEKLTICSINNFLFILLRFSYKYDRSNTYLTIIISKFFSQIYLFIFSSSFSRKTDIRTKLQNNIDDTYV